MGCPAASAIQKQVLAGLLIGLLASAGAASAQLQTAERVWSPPRSGNFWGEQHTETPPLPSLPFDVPVYRLAGQMNGYVFDDRNINYDEIAQARRVGLIFLADRTGLPS